MVLDFTIVIYAAFRSEKTGDKNYHSENYGSPGTVIFGLAKTHNYKHQPKRPSQYAAEPNSQFILFCIAFFCDHILFPFECHLIFHNYNS